MVGERLCERMKKDLEKILNELDELAKKMETPLHRSKAIRMLVEEAEWLKDKIKKFECK